MSFIGPRPYMPKELEGAFGCHARRITSVRPGITGLWQVSGRSHLGPAQRIALDETYVANVHPRTDSRILLRTIRMVLINHGAF
jgi:undecaprenyl-phosphate galactose phosphotransferase